MAPLDQVFSGPFAPPLVGWDSYRACHWGKYALPGCESSDDLEDLLRPAVDPVANAVDDSANRVVDWVEWNISYTWEEATTNTLSWAGSAGLCNVAVKTLGRAGPWGVAGAALTCAASGAGSAGGMINDLLDVP